MQQVLAHKGDSSAMIHLSRLPTGNQYLCGVDYPAGEQYPAFTSTGDSVAESNNKGGEVPVVRQASCTYDSSSFVTGEQKISASAITTGLYPRRRRVFLIKPASLRSASLTTGETTICHRPDKTMDMRLGLCSNTGEVADKAETGSRSAGVHTVRGQATGLQSTLYSLRLSSGGRTVLLPLTSVR